MWKIFNALFGWDYVGWANSADDGIARIFNDTTGRTFYFRYKAINVLDEIKNPEQVVWLTCLPSKYLGKKTIG